MIALVTGASSGLGRDMARSLAKHGINVILTARRVDRLRELKAELTEKYGVKAMYIAADLSDRKQCIELYRRVKKYDIDIFVNNAGFGVFGELCDTDLDRELSMLDVNVVAFHILFKLFLRDFRKRNYGYILNTASLAGFMAGPCFSSYYASKAYVVRMTQAVAEELRAEHSDVHLSMLCPGPVATEFIDTARVRFAVQPMPSAQVAEKAVCEMFAGRLLITTDPVERAGIALLRLVPESVLAYFTRLFQSSRERF